MRHELEPMVSYRSLPHVTTRAEPVTNAADVRGANPLWATLLKMYALMTALYEEQPLHGDVDYVNPLD